MNIFNFKTMALVTVECAKDNECSDLRHISIGCEDHESDNDLAFYVSKYLNKNIKDIQIKNILRIDYDTYQQILEMQIKDYMSMEKR